MEICLKFEVVQSNRSTNEKMQEQCLIPSVKHGGCSSCFGGGKVEYRVEGTWRKDLAAPSHTPWTHPNDPKHSSTMYQQCLKNKHPVRLLIVTEWPGQSPDLNHIELEGEQLDHTVRRLHQASPACGRCSRKHGVGNTDSCNAEGLPGLPVWSFVHLLDFLFILTCFCGKTRKFPSDAKLLC